MQNVIHAMPQPVKDTEDIFFLMFKLQGTPKCHIPVLYAPCCERGSSHSII